VINGSKTEQRQPDIMAHSDIQPGISDIRAGGSSDAVQRGKVDGLAGGRDSLTDAEIDRSAAVKVPTVSSGFASTSTDDFASTSKQPEPSLLSGIWGIARDPVWRPKKFIRNAKYPSISATGFYFQDHSGGFVLIHRATNGYDSFYTKEAIKELEEKYGKAKRQSTARSAARGRRANG
jgi:hypothetical protein